MKAHELARRLLNRPDINVVVHIDGFDWDVLSVPAPSERDDIHPENKEQVIRLFVEY